MTMAPRRNPPEFGSLSTSGTWVAESPLRCLATFGRGRRRPILSMRRFVLWRAEVVALPGGRRHADSIRASGHDYLAGFYQQDTVDLFAECTHARSQTFMHPRIVISGATV